MINQATARAHTNIALIKYWGKRDTKLILPQTDSLSLTLDKFYTDTTVKFNDRLTTDRFSLDGHPQSGKSLAKVSQFLDIVRQKAGISTPADVVSTNHVPTAAGLASSASAYAALASAAAKAAGLDLSRRDLSRLARRGSGSATRSIFGGLVEWHRGTDDRTSYAEPIDEHPNFGLAMTAILLSTEKKKISSRQGMQTVVETSPFYPAWRSVVASDMARIKAAISEHDIDAIGRIAETNAMRMHALNLSADPDFCYFNADTLRAFDVVHHLRATGVSCYYTMDAGPNVKVIYDRADWQPIHRELAQAFGAKRLVDCLAGPGVQWLDD